MKLSNDMCLFNVSLDARYKDLFLITLAKLNGIHIKQKKSEITSKTTEEEGEYREKIKNIRSDLNNLFKKLNISESDLEIKMKKTEKIHYEAKDSHELINHIQEDINFYMNRYSELDNYISDTTIELERIRNIKSAYEFLQEFNLTRDNLSKLEHLNLEVYTTYTKNVSNIRNVFDFNDVPNIIQSQEISNERTAFFIIYPQTYEKTVKERISLIHAEEVPLLRKFLLSNSINFERINNEIELLEDYLSKFENELTHIRNDNLLKFASIEEVISNLEEYNWAASQFEDVSIDLLNYKFFTLQAYKKEIFTELNKILKNNITINILNIEKGGKVAKETVLVQGSIPKDKKKRKKKKEKKRKKEEETEILPGWDDVEKETPTKMTHSWLFRPFETLTKMYGTPSYSEIDPTVFLFFTFPILFGIMFGDIGHGMVLVISGIIGAILFKKRGGGIYNFSWIIFWCGLWAMLGGLVYGEFFGTEEIFGVQLEPVPIPIPFGNPVVFYWLNIPFGQIVLYDPLNNITAVFFAVLFIGVFHLNLGWLLQIVNFIKKSQKYRAFTESLMKILFLDGVFYLIIRYRFDFEAWLSTPFPPILFPLIPGILLLISLPLGKVFKISYLQKSTFGELLTEGSMDTFETMLSVPSNVLSYIRLLALALAHISLMLAIEAMISIIPGEGFWVQLIISIALVFGNVIVILLEGVLVFLNALRLNFYEFFFKFYEGRGIDFIPFYLSENYSTISFEFEQRTDLIKSEIEKEIESQKIREKIEEVRNYISQEYR